MSRARTALVLYAALAASVAIAVPATALAQAMYRMKPIGYLGDCTFGIGVAGLNEANRVVGTACNARGDPHAFVWKMDSKARVDLGPNELGSTSRGYAINASGLVAGSAQDSTGEFGFVSLGDGNPMRRIYNGLGGTYLRAYGVNDSGQVTGEAQKAPPYDLASDAFLWKNDGTPMLALGAWDAMSTQYSSGRAINASGQVIGSSDSDDDRGYYAFVWNNDGSPVLALSLGGYRTHACCINASGQVAGTSSFSGFEHPHAFLWRNDGTPILDLGTLAQAGTAQSGANALNDSGQVAGWAYTKWYGNRHACVWMNDGTPIMDLGTFGGTTSESNDINASGQVTGWASLTGDSITHAFLWRNDGTRKRDLNELIDALDPLKRYVTLTEGVFINNAGNILAYGTDSRTGLSSPYFLQGTRLTLAPRSLAFGNQPINTISVAKSVTVKNNSSKAVAITSIALAGTAARQFAFSQNCGTSLMGYATCTIKVIFRPASKGPKTASLNVNGGGDGLRSVALTGTGIQTRRGAAASHATPIWPVRWPLRVRGLFRSGGTPRESRSRRHRSSGRHRAPMPQGWWRPG